MSDHAMSPADLPTDALLLHLECHSSHLDAIAQQVLAAPVCQELGATIQRCAGSSQTDTAYIYLQLAHSVALSKAALTPLSALSGASTLVRIARLSLMCDILGASHGEAPAFHYAVETTPEAGWALKLQRWYDVEHLPGLASVPGCVRARRYWNYDEGPRSLACYDLVDENVMGSEAWLAVRATDWSSRMRPRFTQTARTMFAIAA